MAKPYTSYFIRLLNTLSRLSWKNTFRISSALNFILFRVVGYRKKVILQNLSNSFPAKTEPEIQSTAHRFYRHFTDLILETIKCRSCPPEDILERIQGDISLVDRLFAENKNILFLMGHRGNWEMANLYASLRFDHQCLVVYRPLKDSIFDQWFLRLRTRFGSRLVPMDDIAAELRQPRDRPYVVVLANDQSPQPDSAYWTPFLHQDTCFFRGAEILARRNDLTVLYADFSRDTARRGYYHVEISLVTDACKSLGKNEILEKQIRMLEADINAQPFNWLWSHRRWKHRRPGLRPIS
ncbi:lysophospholipid acyltransferase family protein [Salmonirosea aquatica]|uniref:Lipid A biosynthesis acyltransferase n=1 Tax=Salmonirosea aquatica TaxID=2654236 RepID=A0A7C9FZD4_9BACT|nr:lipid A biosynthesis acyltransferase [Cytophagaceae bacterium SJW1-29]